MNGDPTAIIPLDSDIPGSHPLAELGLGPAVVVAGVGGGHGPQWTAGPPFEAIWIDQVFFRHGLYRFQNLLVRGVKLGQHIVQWAMAVFLKDPLV